MTETTPNFYADSKTALEAARDNGYALVTIEIDEGDLTVTPAAGLDIFDDLAPGEGFTVKTAHRTNGATATWKAPWWTIDVANTVSPDDDDRVTADPAGNRFADPEHEPTRELDTIEYLAIRTQISTALQTIEDLGQAAADLKLHALAADLGEAYDAVELFRHIAPRFAAGATVVDRDGTEWLVTEKYDEESGLVCIGQVGVASRWVDARELATAKRR